LGVWGGPVTRQSSKADQVYGELKQDIIEGQILPGAPIDKDELCTRFQASRSPVTIAINRLAYERLVLVEPQRGSFVAPIALEEILQLMALRRALESEGVAEAARRGTSELWSTLDRNLVYQRAAIDVTDFRRFYQLDVEFHYAIISASGWTKFNDVLGEARSHLDRVRRVLMPVPGHLDATWAEHRAILDALKVGASDCARREMRSHIDRVARQFEDFAPHHPELFGDAGSFRSLRAVRKDERLSA
jgi:DNA-binding GntR family transcriptional regulator